MYLYESRTHSFSLFRTLCCLSVCLSDRADMIKVRIQLAEGGVGGAKVNTNPFSVAKQLVAKEGFLFLYSGLSAGLIRQATYGMSRLGIFKTLQNHYTPVGGTAADIPLSTTIPMSLCAGGLGALIGTPADSALVRMQADSMLPVEQRRGYKNGLDALVKIARSEGMAGFFTGAAPTVGRGLSLNVGMLTTFAPFKRMNASWAGEGTQLNRFASGFMSGWVAATLCLPFDMIKTRLQKGAKGADGKLVYSGVADAFKKVIANEGFLALYQGYPTFVFRITPHVMITWVTLDNVTSFLSKRNM
jgi:solute carrier family 25 oxoglutarate transporter 11